MRSQFQQECSLIFSICISKFPSQKLACDQEYMEYCDIARAHICVSYTYLCVAFTAIPAILSALSCLSLERTSSWPCDWTSHGSVPSLPCKVLSEGFPWLFAIGRSGKQCVNIDGQYRMKGKSEFKRCKADKYHAFKARNVSLLHGIYMLESIKVSGSA
jgi:hypothetical protein